MHNIAGYESIRYVVVEFSCSSPLHFYRDVNSYIAVHKRGYCELEEASNRDLMACSYGNTLPKDANCSMASSWAMADPSTFLIRGKTYLHDRQKVCYYTGSLEMCLHLLNY